MKRLLKALLLAGVLFLGSCGSGWYQRLDQGGIFHVPEKQWDVTMHLDYDGDGDIDTVIYHYTLWKNGDIDIEIEVID